MSRVRFRDQSGMTRTGELSNGIIQYCGETYDQNEVDILPPTNPSKIVLVGRNLRDSVEAKGFEVPQKPRLFFVPPSAIIGHKDTVTLSNQLDHVVYGAEMGVVIGEQCRRVSKERAMDVVEGFTCVNDLSNPTDSDIDPGYARVKGFDNAKPVGPVIADPADVPEDATIELRTNGKTVQRSSRSEFIYTVPEIIEEATSYFTLECGDIISMGSPAGNAAVEDGDTIDVEIEGIGTLTHYVER